MILAQLDALPVEEREALIKFKRAIGVAEIQLVTAEQEGDESAAKRAVRDLISDFLGFPDVAVRFTAETLLNMTSAPDFIKERLQEVAPLLLRLVQPQENSEVLNERVWSLVNEWYNRWRRDTTKRIEPENQIQIEVLFDLLQTFYNSETIEEVASKAPLWPRLRAVHQWGEKFQDSSWFSHIAEDSRALVKGHVEAMEHVLIRWEQEAQYDSKALVNNLFVSQAAGMPADAHLDLEQLEMRLPSTLKKFAVEMAKRQTMRKLTPDDPAEFRALLEPV